MDSSYSCLHQYIFAHAFVRMFAICNTATMDLTTHVFEAELCE